MRSPVGRNVLGFCEIPDMERKGRRFSQHKLFMFVVKCHRMPEMAVWHFFCFIGEEPDWKRMNGENKRFLCSSFFIAVYPEENVSAGFLCMYVACHNQLRLFMDNYFKERWKKQ